MRRDFIRQQHHTPNKSKLFTKHRKNKLITPKRKKSKPNAKELQSRMDQLETSELNHALEMVQMTAAGSRCAITSNTGGSLKLRRRFTAEREAIEFEVQRGGQIYFIHNRIDNIHEFENKLQRLLPNIKIRVGHGRMDGKKFEKNLLDFMEVKYDLLLATTIVENGLDIPNANTIFIYNAQNFGLSDLHQMRGRVGRSNKKAFCYFITINCIS